MNIAQRILSSSFDRDQAFKTAVNETSLVEIEEDFLSDEKVFIFNDKSRLVFIGSHHFEARP